MTDQKPIETPFQTCTPTLITYSMEASSSRSIGDNPRCLRSWVPSADVRVSARKLGINAQTLKS
jgi:hypothetical protein